MNIIATRSIVKNPMATSADHNNMQRPTKNSESDACNKKGRSVIMQHNRHLYIRDIRYCRILAHVLGSFDVFVEEYDCSHCFTSMEISATARVHIRLADHRPLIHREEELLPELNSESLCPLALNAVGSER